MKWERMQKPLREGMQVFRLSWPEDAYVMVEDGHTLFFSAMVPMGADFAPTYSDVEADDWAATGPSGE